MTLYLRSWFGTATKPTTSDSSHVTSTEHTSLPPTPSLHASLASNHDRNAPAHSSVSISTLEETQSPIEREPRAPTNGVLKNASPVRTRMQRSRGLSGTQSDAQLMPPPPIPAVSDDDSPPTFPSLTSIQRANAPHSSEREFIPPSIPAPRRTGTTSFLIPPAPPNIRIPSARAVSTASRSNKSNTLQLPQSTVPPSKRREKVVLAPGHSTLDWAALKASGEDLRGVSTLLRITPSQLKRHNKRDDAWTAIHGKVFNITPYLPFHPGGEKELMRVAGRDGTKLFALTHIWVNVDIMLDECLVGFLIPEPYPTA